MYLLSFITIMIGSLTLGLAFSHLMQLPTRMGFDGPTWITTQRVFPLYGSVGGPLEISAVLLTGILAYVARNSQNFGWILAGSISFALALVVWIVFVAPANGQISQWSVDSIPPDWNRWRTQWEYAHAFRACLMLFGFAFILRAVLTASR